MNKDTQTIINPFDIIDDTDSYKCTHHIGLNKEAVTDYLEARVGAQFPETVVYGVSEMLEGLANVRITQDMIEEEAIRCKFHFFGNEKLFNREMWEYIVNEFDGKLPVRISSVDEGTVVPVDNVMLQIENLGGKLTAALPGHLETFFLRVWYPMTVATKSREVKKILKRYLDLTSDDASLLPFMLHDFGARGTTNQQAAATGGSAHLINFLGTDTKVAMTHINRLFGDSYEGLGYSIFATEHSLMTSEGEDGELKVIRRCMERVGIGMKSFVADSYDYYRHVAQYVGQDLKEFILDQYKEAKTVGIPNKYVIRPDSCTPEHQTPEELVVWTYEQLERDYGVTVNSKGYKELHPAVGVIWGDGIDIDGIEKILEALTNAGYATTTQVFGMGGGLLQKVNRDTMRFAFKCCAQMVDGVWGDVQKNPLDTSKKSKAGRQALTKDDAGNFITVREDELGDRENFLKVHFECGEILIKPTFAQIRERCAL